MKLSQVNTTPLYPVTIPSSKKKAKYRPILVKEERALLAAQESEDIGVMLETLKNVVQQCVEPSSSVESLTSFDLEYLYTLIRSKSVGEFSELIFRCDTCEDEKAKTKVSIDLRTVEVAFPENISNKIKLSESITVLMKYPTMDELIDLEKSEEDEKSGAIKACIQSIFVEEEVYHASEETPEELEGFLDSLTSKQYRLLESFVENIPTAQIKVSYKCPVCNKEHNKSVKGLHNFF